MKLLKLLYSIVITSCIFLGAWGIDYLSKHVVNFGNYFCYGIIFLLMVGAIYLCITDRNTED